MKCISTNACSMGNKQGELEAIVHQENCGTAAIAETWWDVLRDWSASINAYKLFVRDRQGKRGVGVDLYIRDCYDCLELNYNDDTVECL